MSDNVTYDVVVIGAGPAGAAVSGYLAAKGCKVVMVEQTQGSRSVPCAGWISVKAEPLLEELGVIRKDIAAQPVSSVTFHDPPFAKSAVPNFSEPPALLINRTQFDERLIHAATGAGATLMAGAIVTAGRPREMSVTVTLEEADAVHGRLLVVATGRESALLEQLHLPRESIPAGWRAAHVETDEGIPPGEARLAVILGLDDSGGFGMIAIGKERASVSVQIAAGTDSVVAAITTLCKQAAQQGILNVDLSHQAARSKAVMTPAAVSLEMETHVAKRTLIIGDAGGFVSATSGEGIYPAIWSARIAADVIHEALDSPSPQDVLMQFNTRWRTQMAEYLRPPNTDAQYILPLVFTNQPMADKMGAAFFSGENI